MPRTSVLHAALLSAVLLAAVPAAVRAQAAPDTALVHVGPADAGTRAFVAWPAGKATAPAVLVVHEWWGLNGQIREVAMRLAREGYVAIVPDLYHGKVADDPERAHEILRGIEESDAVADAAAARAWLKRDPRTAKSRVAVLGFCFGGRIALLLGLQEKDLAGVVMFYGTPVVDPHRLAALSAPLQGHFGDEDQGIPPEKVRAFRAALAQAHRDAELFSYVGAGHAFMHEGRMSYHPDAARQAWARTLAFLQKRLKG